MAVVSPFSPDGAAEVFWRALCGGECAVAPVRSFDASAYSCRVAAEIDRSAIGDGDPAHRMADIAFRRALADASLPVVPGESPRYRGGVIVGTVLGGIRSGERYLAEGDRSHLPSYPLRSIAARLADEAGFTGPLLTVSTACASGSDAVGIGARKVARGEADVVVAGGVDALCEFSFSGFHALRALTPDRVRPFSANRTGLAPGEGAAFLVLERADRARRRGARSYGSVAGYGALPDAVHLTAPDRDAGGLTASILAALRDGGAAPGEVDYVNAHGTGTPYNDWMECKAMGRVFGDRARTVPASSIKGALGHSFGAAGAIEAAACLLAIRYGVLPPTLNFEEPDPGCDIDCVPNRARRAAVRAALSLSAGFGGQNAALLFRGEPS
jgi:3-oxoacyl-(acyl-carrier-protein) synthase